MKWILRLFKAQVVVIRIHAVRLGLAGNTIERSSAAHRAIHDYIVGFRSLRRSSKKNQDVQVIGLAVRRFLAELQGLGGIALVEILLRELPLTVTDGFLVAGKL